MKINEVEKSLNIPKATIRFYEKEGLLNPQRNNNSYREYSNNDIDLLKKIIVLRKIGMSVEDIRFMLDDKISLQEALTSNIDTLYKQVEQLEGAIKICKMIKNTNESFHTLDKDYYWNVIHVEEEKGNKFFAIVNDVITFEKSVIANEFNLLDDNGNMKFSLKISILIAFGMCTCAGTLWYFLDGMKINAFFDGFFFPFVCIVISSILGLPVYFIEKKNAKAASLIKKIGYILAVLFLVIIVLLMLFLE